MQAQSADGVIHDFPAGTDMSVIDRVMKSYASDARADGGPAPAQPASSGAEMTPQQMYGGAVPGAGPTSIDNTPIAAFARSAIGRLSGTDRPPADSGEPEDTIAPGLRSALAPAANTTYGSVLPFARDQDTGELRLALPSSLRDLATGGLDLLEGPTTGKVTPAATNLLANVAMGGGLTPSVARGTGIPIAQVADFGAPDAALYGSRAAGSGRTAAEGNLLADFPRPAATVADIGKATDIDGAIAAAGEAAQAPFAPVTATQVQARDGVGIMEAWRRAHAENAAGEAESAAPGEAAVPQAASSEGDLFAQQPAAAAATPLGWSVDDRFGSPADSSPYVPITSTQVQARDGVGAVEASRRAAAENAAGAAPLPQSAGAAASRDMTNPALADISTADMKANRRVAEQEEILRPPQANDTMIYVPGSFPTLAERRGDPVLSQYENLLRQRKADQFVGDGKVLTENNKARIAEFDTNTIPDTTLTSMRRDRDARFAAASDDILPTAKPADLTPALDWVQEQLSNPRIQENDAVRSVLENFQDRIVTDGGDLKTDPAAVWGMHDHLQNLLARAKDPLNATGSERFAQSQILKMKQLIDQAMNVATDNRFQSALDSYAEDSKAINAGVLFNDFRPKLTNMSGDLQAANFHNFVKGLAKERGDPGIDPSMDISDRGMRSMINIDTDLKRAGLIRLGAAAGSPTNLLGALAEKAGLDAAHSIVGSLPYVGPVLNVVPKYLADRKLIADTAKHLAPPEGGYRYPEPEEPSAGPAAPNRPPPGGGGPSGTSGPGTPSPAPRAAPALAQAAPPTAPAAPAVAAPVRATTGAGPGESIAFTPSGAPVAVRYTVRDASNLIASQLADGRTNPAFPAGLQPRDRTRAASIQQVNSIANRLQPERLGASASTSEGAPIIGPDGAVESGNGRTMAIMQAYADGGPLADAYRQWVSAQGHDTSRMQNPVLVRERLGDLDMPARARLAADMGASPIAAMSAPERAAADARAMPADILSMYQGGDVTLAKNAPFARAFAEHVIPPGEQAGFMTADGEMSADGAVRMRNALTQHAYGSNSLVTSLAENADPDIKMFGGALMDAAGEMAKLRGAIDSGTVSRASDIAPDIVAAAQLIQTARRQRISLADAVGQRDAFSVLPEKTEDILQAAFGDDYAGRMSRARMADLLSAFAQEARMQSGLFGANLTAGEMLAEARAKYGYGTKTGAKGGSGVPVRNGPGLDFNRP